MIERSNKHIDLRGLILVAVAGAWVAGIWLGSMLLLPTPLLLISAGLALTYIVLFRHDALGRLFMLLLLCLALGAWRYTLSSPLHDPQAISAFISDRQLVIRGTVSGEPKLQGRSRVLIIAVNQVSQDGGIAWQDVHGQMEAQTLGTVIEDPYAANYGDSVELRGKLQGAAPHSPPDIFAGMAFPRTHVVDTGGNPLLAFLYHLRVMLATILTQALPQPEAALLIGILLGLKTPALRPLTMAFNVTGTAHMIVPSGFKVTVLAGIVAGSTRWLEKGRKQEGRVKLLPAQKRGGWRRWLTTGLVLLSIIAYTILSGAGPAAIRAGVMGSLLVLAPRLGRTYNIYTALALTALGMSILDPFVIWDVGFQLSFLGTLGIVLLTPFFQRLLHPLTHLPLGHYITEIMAVTLAAQIATLPIMAITFQNISFIGPIANMLTVPLLGVFIFLGLLICAAGLIFAPLAALCAWVAWPLLWYMVHIVSWCANLPGAYLSISNLDSGVAWLYYSAISLLHVTTRGIRSATPTQDVARKSLGISWRAWHGAQLGAALLIILATGTSALAAQSNPRLTVTFLAVGPPGQPVQGESILVRTSDNKTILIDGGLDATSLSQALDSQLPPWQRSLDMVLLTTPARDHITGLQDIVTRYSIGTIIDAGMLHPNAAYALWRHTISERNIRYLPVVQGTTVPLGQLALQILWPSTLHKSSNEDRDNTLIVRLVTPGLRILLLGAAAQSPYALNGLLTNLDASYLQADIVQIVGEFNKPSATELGVLLQKAHPSYLVITPATMSAQQRKLNPSALPLAPPVPGGSDWKIVQTAEVGALEVSSDGNTWNIGIP